MLSRHAMTAAFLRDRWGSDQRWCCSKGRRDREHLFKECLTWKREIRTLWRVGDISGSRGRDGGTKENVPQKSKKGFGYMVLQKRTRPSNTTMWELLTNDRLCRVVLKFLRDSKVGNVKEGTLERG